MVLTPRPGDAVIDRVPAVRPETAAGERGSQALEFAMILPLVGVLLGLFVHAGLLLADVVAAQGVVREVARTAAVDGDDDARTLARRLADGRRLRLHLDRDDGLVEARVELRSEVFGDLGAGVWIPARAVMRVEQPAVAP